MEQEEGKGRRICVSGGNGFIASWIIKRLIEHGYSVNATIRSSSGDKKDVSFLTNLAGASSQKLQIFHNTDLSKPESFKEAIEGCIGVFHVATPMDFEEKEPEEIVTKRSINGALGIMKLCLNSNIVKKFVYTSSASAVCYNGNEDYELVMDESFWGDVDFLRNSKPFGWSYAISKTLTEKAVLEFGEEHGLDVVTVIPPFVVGPFICPKLPGSVRSSLYFLFGEKEHASYEQTPMVHVDDVARAHIFVLEHPNVKGRYICSACLVTPKKASQILFLQYPQFQIPTIYDDDDDDFMKKTTCRKFHDLSSKKLLDAGFEFKHGIEDMFVDAIECCIQRGYL